MEHEEAVVGVTVRDDEKGVDDENIGVDDEKGVPVVREEQKIHFSSQVTQSSLHCDPTFFLIPRGRFIYT